MAPQRWSGRGQALQVRRFEGIHNWLGYWRERSRGYEDHFFHIGTHKLNQNEEEEEEEKRGSLHGQ
jgi:hypothetical protein